MGLINGKQEVSILIPSKSDKSYNQQQDFQSFQDNSDMIVLKISFLKL